MWPRCLAFGLLFVGFLAWECPAAHPAVDLSLFANAGFSAGAVVVLLIYSTSTSLFLCFALLLQTGIGLSSFEAGLLFAPASVGFVVASLIAPKLVARWGNGTITGGALIYALGIGWLILTASGLAGREHVLALLPALILFGFGLGLSMTPLCDNIFAFKCGRKNYLAPIQVAKFPVVQKSPLTSEAVPPVPVSSAA